MSKTMKRIEFNIDAAPPKVDESKGKYDDPEPFADKLNSIIQHNDVNNDVDVRIKDMKEISQNLVGVSMATNVNVRALKKLEPLLKSSADRITNALAEYRQFEDRITKLLDSGSPIQIEAQLTQESRDKIIGCVQQMLDKENELVKDHLKGLRRQVGDEGIWLSNKAFWWTIAIVYGMLVMAFFLGCFWCRRRFG